MFRYDENFDDGREGADNPDLAASFDAVTALTRLGRWDEAHGRMEAMVPVLGPLGLPGDTADPISGEIFGNIPSTSAALALVEAVQALAGGPR